MITDVGSELVNWCANELAPMEAAARPGGRSKQREFDDPAKAIRFLVYLVDETTYASKDTPFFSPRHRHTFDQLRYYHTGGVKYGDKVYGPGDVLYIPAGTFYGPMTYPDPTRQQVLLQFEGTSGMPYYSGTDFEQAKARLEKHGRFDQGIYVPDTGRRQDAWEAMLEEHTGEPATYPEPAVDNYVVVHTGRLRWHDVPGSPGVQRKYVGHFSDAGPHVTLLRMSAGARTEPGRTSASYQQLRVVFEGQARFAPGDRTYGPVSCSYVPPETDHDGIEADEDAVVLSISWAIPGQLLVPEVA